MRIKTTILAAIALITANAFAGEITIDSKNPLLPPTGAVNFLKSADIDVFGMYVFGSDDFEDTYGIGGSLGWKLNNVIGLETEYWYIDGPQLHNAALNAVLQLPVGTDLAIRPFVGGGIAATNDVRALGQAGVDLLWSPTRNWSVLVGYRYVYRDDYSDYQGATAGFGFTF